MTFRSWLTLGVVWCGLWGADRFHAQGAEAYRLTLTGTLYVQEPAVFDGVNVRFPVARLRISTKDLLEFIGSSLQTEFPPKSYLEMDEMSQVWVKYRGVTLADATAFFTIKFASGEFDTLVSGTINLGTGLNRSRFIYPFALRWHDPEEFFDFTMEGMGFESYTKSPLRDGTFRLKRKLRSKVSIEGALGAAYFLGEGVVSFSGGGMLDQ